MRLGFGGGMKTFFKSFARGEVNAMTRLVYNARENCPGAYPPRGDANCRPTASSA